MESDQTKTKLGDPPRLAGKIRIVRTGVDPNSPNAVREHAIMMPINNVSVFNLSVTFTQVTANLNFPPIAPQTVQLTKVLGIEGSEYVGKIEVSSISQMGLGDGYQMNFDFMDAETAYTFTNIIAEGVDQGS